LLLGRKNGGWESMGKSFQNSPPDDHPH
jgi:hypothetical protein